MQFFFILHFLGRSFFSSNLILPKMYSFLRFPVTLSNLFCRAHLLCRKTQDGALSVTE